MSDNEISKTLKSADTEEFLDIIFYRKLGYQVAKFSARHGIRPNTITIISIFWGVLAGHLYYYNHFWINLAGVFSLMIANTLDSTDGQLARMTNDKTRLGRILDGLAGNIWFISIYVHLALRLLNNGYDYWVLILGGLTGAFHIFQAAIADYYRNAHLYFVKGESGSEFHNSSQIKAEIEDLSWKKHFWYKLFMKSYLNYTREQELFTRNLQKLISVVKSKFPEGIPDNIREGFRRENKPLMPLTNILTFNTRAIALWIAVLINQPILYWVFEITVLNAILFYMVSRNESISKKYLNLIEQPTNTTLS
ncbi:MAG: CDP-alcohol phosphatidyltransferase family protein [Bacteroidales bacterium]|nr:CDP-alcohol phosphatidyltransferase family protein [Bacteroidales bacterium]